MQLPANMDRSSSSSSGDDWEVISTSSSLSPTPQDKEAHTKTATTTTKSITAGTLTFPPLSRPTIPIMPGWKDEYLSSLLEADKNNKPVNNQVLVEACKCPPPSPSIFPSLPPLYPLVPPNQALQP